MGFVVDCQLTELSGSTSDRCGAFTVYVFLSICFSVLKLEIPVSSEMSVLVYQAALCYIPVDVCENSLMRESQSLVIFITHLFNSKFVPIRMEQGIIRNGLWKSANYDAH
jgi:hypothetical protein